MDLLTTRPVEVVYYKIEFIIGHVDIYFNYVAKLKSLHLAVCKNVDVNHGHVMVKYTASVGSMLFQNLRCWYNIEPTVGHHLLVF